jgi:GT2 family glycosyltransferase
MSRPPALSVIVPTAGRPEGLWRLLRALAAQRLSEPFEVVVVVDGAPAEAAGSAPRAEWAFPVIVHRQGARGPAAARNRGVDGSRGGLLVFLDDDLEPEVHTLAAHAAFHSRRSRAIGAGDLEPSTLESGLVGAALAGWWDVVCDGLRDQRHRFTFRDLLSGHCSMRRETFLELGGFDPSFRCHEDFELGYRAIAHGIELRFVEAADARHHDASSLSKILARKFDEGLADVQLVRKHPRLLPVLPLGRPLSESRIERAAHDAVLDGAVRGRVVASACRRSMAVFNALSMRDKWRAALESALTASYWRGALREAGSAAAIRELRERDVPPGASPLVVDIGIGLELAERMIDDIRPPALRVLMRGELVCQLDEMVGAEPLRGMHLRPLLLKGFAREYAAACARAGVLPDGLRGCLSQNAIEMTSGPGARTAGAVSADAA